MGKTCKSSHSSLPTGHLWTENGKLYKNIIFVLLHLYNVTIIFFRYILKIDFNKFFTKNCLNNQIISSCWLFAIFVFPKSQFSCSCLCIINYTANFEKERTFFLWNPCKCSMHFASSNLMWQVLISLRNSRNCQIFMHLNFRMTHFYFKIVLKSI